MGGLSKDPAKAQRQRDALAAGRRKLAERELGGAPPAKAAAKPKAKAPAKASKSKRAERVTYSEESERAPAKPRKQRDRRDDPPRRGGGFFRGLRGQLD